MSRSGSEKRKLDGGLVGVRFDAEQTRLLNDLAAAAGITRAEFLRRLFVQSTTGAPGAEQKRIGRRRRLAAAEDRQLLTTFSRYAGRLTGALIQSAKAARLAGMVSYHAELEMMLREVRDLKRRVDTWRVEMDE